MSARAGGKCRACQRSKRRCSLGESRKPTTRATKKSEGGAAATKKAKELGADPIEVGDSAGEEEIVVKQEGAPKAKRKAVDFAEEMPKKKKAKVEDDRGEGGSQGIDVSVEEARTIGKKWFPELYFGKSKAVWMSRTRLLATDTRLDWLRSERAVLGREIVNLRRLRLFINTALENPEMMEDDEEAEEYEEDAETEEE